MLMGTLRANKITQHQVIYLPMRISKAKQVVKESMEWNGEVAKTKFAKIKARSNNKTYPVTTQVQINQQTKWRTSNCSNHPTSHANWQKQVGQTLR